MTVFRQRVVVFTLSVGLSVCLSVCDDIVSACAMGPVVYFCNGRTYYREYEPLEIFISVNQGCTSEKMLSAYNVLLLFIVDY